MKYWIISAMDTVPKEGEMIDVVQSVHWRRVCQEKIDEKEYVLDIYDVQYFEPPHESSFTPYDELTFEQVCGWLENSLDVQKLDESLDAQLQSLINPPLIQLPLPWIQKEINVETPIEKLEENA